MTKKKMKLNGRMNLIFESESPTYLYNLCEELCEEFDAYYYIWKEPYRGLINGSTRTEPYWVAEIHLKESENE